jgi:hypothetical protein
MDGLGGFLRENCGYNRVSGNIMKRHSCILTIILTLTFGTAFAHQDFWTFADYGNVKVRVKTGFDYEEINKAFIIGQLAEKLSKELNYSNPIFLDFNHHYTGDCNPTYFISYDKGKIEYTWESASKEKNYLKSNSIVVRQVSKQFNVISTLRLLEYSIKNISSIKSSQKQIEYNQNYCQWIINSIDATLIKEQLQKASSALLNNIVKLRIERPDKNFKYGISYFWQDNKFHIFLRDYNKPDTTLASIENIYDLKKLGGSSAMVFDTDSSFFYVCQYNRPIVSQRQVINNTNDYYRPFKIENVGGDKFSIYFYYYTNEVGLQPKERTLIYLTEKDELIQDLDKLIDKK